MCLHNPDCYIFHTRGVDLVLMSASFSMQNVCLHNPDCYILHTSYIFIQVSILSLCQPVLACKMCLHNPDCYIFHTRCRSCPYVSQFQHAKCACIIRTVIFFIQEVSILSLCQPVLACKMCLHNPDCYIFHTKCRSCPYVSQFQHAKCACIIRTVIYFHTRCRSCPYVSQFQHAKCACIIRTVIFFIQRSISILSIIRTVMSAAVLACKMCLHNPDCYIFHTRCRSCPYVSQFQHAKCACIIRTVIFFIQEVSILSLCQPVLACKMCLHNPDCYIFHTKCRSCPYASQFQHAKCACIIRTVIFFIQGVDLVPMSASFSMQNVLA